MINFEEELKKFHPSLEIDEAELLLVAAADVPRIFW